MNVSAAASFQVPYPQTLKANTETAQPEKVEGPVVNEQRGRFLIDKIMGRGEQKGYTFEDLKEVEAFLETNDRGPDDCGLYFRMKRARNGFLLGKEIQAGIKLREMEEIYSDFKKDLQNKWSGLANKPMGFTVAEDGQLKVTSPPDTLTARDEEILNTLLNETKGLQTLTLKHAKLVIELVQMDKPQFEGKVNLDLRNFHKMIDYGLLLNKGALDLRNSDSWLDQLHKKAEKEPSEKKQGLHIEA